MTGRLNTEVVIFGGTTEGRLLAESCSRNGIAALYCAATALGALSLPGVAVRTGRLDTQAMTELLRAEAPALVLDATHPYAREASDSIEKAAAASGTRLLRVLREAGSTEGCEIFHDTAELVSWLSRNGGNIFAATGLKEAELFTQVPGFRERVWFRLLPGVEGLEKCLSLGYPAEHLVMMYGPFSRELNLAMFRAADAALLVTKDSGDAGGFREKVDAARELGMRVALMARPPESRSASSAGLETALEMLRGFGDGAA